MSSVKSFVVGIAILTLLSGCGSILDPAPWSPYDAGASLMKDQTTAYKPGELLSFAFFDDAETKLQVMADGYAAERNLLMRQELAFDIPTIGLGVAALVSVPLRGGVSITEGTGIGAATIAGAKTYFQPGTKISSYNDAAASLRCAGGAATILKDVDTNYVKQDTAGAALDDKLEEVTARLQSTDGKDTAADKAKLLSARDGGLKSYTNFEDAIKTMETGPGKMAVFAQATVANSIKIIITGLQSPKSILDQIKAGLPSSGSAAPAVKAAPESPKKPLKTTANTNKPSVDTLVAELKQYDINADAKTKIINDAWSLFTACNSTK